MIVAHLKENPAPVLTKMSICRDIFMYRLKYLRLMRFCASMWFKFDRSVYVI